MQQIAANSLNVDFKGNPHMIKIKPTGDQNKKYNFLNADLKGNPQMIKMKNIMRKTLCCFYKQ